MRFVRAERWSLVLALSVLPAGVVLSEQDAGPATAGQPAQATDARPNLEGLPWVSSLAEGHRQALVQRKPVLIRVDAGWCPICRKQAEELKKGELQAELSRWTRVHVDRDLSPEEADQLEVAAVPAWRIRTAGGQTVATLDGYLPAEDLLEWLGRHYEAARAAPADVLLEAGQPDRAAVVRLLRQFDQRNPAIREAAIRRLLPYPEAGRAAVVKAFGEGNLATRLAALELLREWKAPVEGIDPWLPETITDGRTAGLQRWCDEELAQGEFQSEELSEKQLARAREEIDRMLRSDEAQCEAIRERLARIGPALLPEVYARLKEAVTDQDRQRLLALRYRVVAADALVLRWSAGITRLAATDSKERREAAQELARLATGDDQRLLLELFSDPDPLVREISLQGLQFIGGKEATAALVKLLADPEPNVRAAVLKQLEENPQAGMVPKVAEYLKTEKDADLVVHAVRFLRTAGGPEAVKSLISLLDHESWQVRAEAAAAVGGSDISYPTGFEPSYPAYPGDDESAALRADAYVALLKLLDDPDAFVVSRAVEGLAGVDMAVAVEPLVRAAVQHPNLASQILEILARGETIRAKALPHLRKFCGHEDPAIRAAALAGLCQAAPYAADKELAAGLDDPQSSVRVAAASALFDLLEKSREQAAGTQRSPMTFGPFSGPFGVTRFEVEAEGGLIGTVVRQVERELLDEDETLIGQFAKLFKGRSTPESTKQLAAAEDTKPEAGPDEDTEVEPPSDEGREVEPPSEEDTDVGPPPGDAGPEKPPSDQEPDEPPTSKWDQWLEKFYQGQGRPEWATQMIPPLEKMLQAEAAEERMAAAQTLVPLGKADLALPVMIETVRSHPEHFERATAVLPWLVWPKRLSTFTELRALGRNQSSFAALVWAMIVIPDRRAADLFWDLLADQEMTVTLAASLQQGLSGAYAGQSYFGPWEMSASARRELVREAKSRATTGSELQRLAALALLAGTAEDEAAELAAKLADDPQLSDPLRRDAFQVLLVTLPEKEAMQAAIAALSSDDAARRELALVRLVGGHEQLSVLRQAFHMSFDVGAMLRGAPIVPEPPPGLQVQQIRPLVNDSDPKTAAYAGYLLALFGYKEGLDPLLRYWRGQDRGDDHASRLVYRAIAALNDSAHIAVLEEIYGGLQEYEMSEFYWTIRIMSGPEILRLRKRIRDEVGMENLRY